MKKIILMAAAAFLISSGSFAQIQRKVDTTQSMHSKQRQHDMMAQLNLSKEQKQKMKEMRQANKEKFDAVKNDNSLTQEQKKAKMMELRKAQKSQMNSILTREQQQKMKSYKKEHHHKHGRKMQSKKWNDKKRDQNRKPAENS